jgi:DNA repair protein RadC
MKEVSGHFTSTESSSINKGIKSWPSSERPRERLLKEGTQVLSDAELLAVLLRNGVPGKDAVSLARELLSKYGGLRGLLSVSAAELQKTKGLGAAKTASLAAVMEMAKRGLKEEMIGKDYLRDPGSAMTFLYASLRDKKKEVLKVLFLNKANCILAEADLSEGTIDEAAIHPREVVKAALEKHATAIVLVHNHPSGRIEPSAEDKIITVKLQQACQSVGVKVLDHIIVGDNRYFSFVEHGCMP